MIFCDLENFRHSIRKNFPEDKKVDVNFEKFHYKLFDIIVEKLNSKIHNPRLIRAYIYTGLYTKSQIDKAKKHLANIPEEQRKIQEQIEKLEGDLKKEKQEWKIKKLNYKLRKAKLKQLSLSDDRVKLLKEEIEIAEYRKTKQEELFRTIGHYNFLELKLKPLKYSYKDLRFVQKGTDVEMAVDITNYAHFANYDIAIVCTGDVDLLESCRLIKTLGKTFILVSHHYQVGDTMVQASDFYIDTSTFTESDLQQIAKVE